MCCNVFSRARKIRKEIYFKFEFEFELKIFEPSASIEREFRA